LSVDLLLKGGKAFVEGELVPANIGITKETIVSITAPREPVQAKRVVNVRGLWLLPGVIDMHSHHREPGFTHKEDIITATQACAAGGVTVSVAMPNVSPPPTSARSLRNIFELYRKKAIIDYNMNPSATVLEEIPKMVKMGILAFKIFMVVDTGRSYPHMPGIGVHDHGKILSIFEEVEKTGLPIMVHPHDQELMDVIEQKFWAKGQRDFRAYAKAYSSYDGAMWDTAIGVLLNLQRATGVHLHLLHMQTKKSLEMLKKVKAEGQLVTAEVNPWALWLSNDWKTVERLGSYALSYYVAPHHSDAVRQAILDGTVDIIATDHAPHTKKEKEPGWKDGWKAHTGTPSAQYYLSLLLDDIHKGQMTLKRLVELVAIEPARIFKLYPRKGIIRIGSDADIVAVDPNKKATITHKSVLSKCGWTPFAGYKVRGVPVHTILRGQFVYKNGKVVGKPGYGQLAKPVNS
jgi:dihydroorotase